MKRLILLLTLFSTLVLAEGIPLTLKVFSTNEEINSSNISQYASQFKTHTQDEEDVDFEIVLFKSEDNATLKQNDTYMYNWIMIELDENLSSGNYWIEHIDFEFTKHTFSTYQFVNKFSLFGRKIFSFEYNRTKDSKRYFLQAVTNQSHVVPLASLFTPQNFSKYSVEFGSKMLLSFFLFGLIFMAAIYNGALYLYNREKSFLYYMLMQFFMVGVLVYLTDIVDIYVMGDVEKEEPAIFFYFILVEVVILFVLFFIRSFLETKKYLPFHDKVLHYITLFAVLDLVLFFIPIMMIFSLHSFILLYVLWVAWLRLKQGYKPALFFLFGWFALMVSVFLSDFFPDDYFALDPILIGSTIEALFLAMAVSYKMHEIKNEKEEQKELLVHQSRLASMGDMLGNIAHQWRQPLTRLGYILMNIEEKDKQSLHEKKLEEASTQLEFMSQTIDDFRNFYAPTKAKEEFSLAEESQKVIDLISFEKVALELLIIKDSRIFNYKNEYKQVLLNLLSNARDVLLERKVTSSKVTLEIDGVQIKVSDNGGGIKHENMQKIFEPYFSTKEGGLGIGLYMSKMIIEKNMGGTISVDNDEEGAVFSLDFK